MKQSFWVVWRRGGGSPTCEHDSWPEAVAEAERLARKHPGSEFVVLKPSCGRKVIEVHEIEYDDGLPF